ncbi:MAG: serine/threonine protein kinase [Desulfobacterales bacterium]|nr:serine/threonine protein kinase [Desulfobacterales bacterium]
MHKNPFAVLTPDNILTCVENALGCRLLNLCRPHSSYINRVYELQREDGTFFIAKFFRPGRWSKEALLEELAFVLDCAQNDITVVAPMQQVNGNFLGSFNGMQFTLYPRFGGRVVDEYSDEQWLELGRLLGRVHGVGSMRQAIHRNRLHPQQTTRLHSDYILSHKLITENFVTKFKRIVDEIINEISVDFENLETIRIHGDCHSGNLIYRPGESFGIIDFDDMVTGPPVQDIWMLLPGPLEDSRTELSLLLEGYETFRPFDRRTLRIIESLRAMRFIHYICWCGWQFVEDGETRIDDSFGSFSYWSKEIGDLEDQLEIVKKSRIG